LLAAPRAPPTCVWFNGYGVMGFAVVSLPSVVNIETAGPSPRDHVNQSNTVPIRIKSRMATDGTATVGTATSGTATAGTDTAGTATAGTATAGTATAGTLGTSKPKTGRRGTRSG